MSKSMWISAVDIKPAHESEKFSVDVAFWVMGEERPFWGHYDYDIGSWVSTDKTGYSPYYPKDRVEYFAYIDNPYK